ncbi:MAG TPA: DUF1361 domain-containing protein [Opitutaceae bacterium]|nr:DUF1361 domain-containing protein [Opitutaceae bacterium]
MLRTLAIASAICIGMVLVRFAYVGTLRFRFCGLLLNLLLAWVPLLLAVPLRHLASERRRLLLWGTFAAWLLFFPNAFYLTTDLVHNHKFGTDDVFRWYDLLMTVGFASAGMFLGSTSLNLLHIMVRQRRGPAAGWLFALAMLALGSFGVYLGRFLRLNSWHVLTEPAAVAHAIVATLSPPGIGETAAFCAAFFAFSVAVYCFVLSTVHLRESPVSRSSSG